MPSPSGSRSSDHTVALFVDRFLPYSQTFIYDEIQAHTRYDVEVFCNERINEERFPYERYVKPNSTLGERFLKNVGYWPSFDRRLGAGNHDLIHAHFGTAAVYALPYVLRHDLPFAVTFHGIDVADLFGPRRFLPLQWRYWAYSGWIFDRATMLLADSIELAELLISLGAPAQKMRVQRLGVDLNRFYRADDTTRSVPRVTMVGRFTEKKGFLYGLRACAKLLTEGRAFEVTLVGSGEREPIYRHLLHENGIADQVAFAGVLTPAQVADTLARSDVLLAPSVVTRTHDRDSGLIVAKEASASEAPVIGTYHGGIPSIIDDGETGFLVPERNVEALADRLATLIDDAALRRRFGQAARRKMEKAFDLHEQTQKLERRYDAIRTGTVSAASSEQAFLSELA
jgi:colanic acid/amylovoran biosynthesis glycosyltransferase